MSLSRDPRVVKPGDPIHARKATQQNQYQAINTLNQSAVLLSNFPLSISNPIVTDILRFDGTNWINASAIPGPFSIGTAKVASQLLTLIPIASMYGLVVQASTGQTLPLFQVRDSLGVGQFTIDQNLNVINMANMAVSGSVGVKRGLTVNGAVVFASSLLVSGGVDCQSTLDVSGSALFMSLLTTLSGAVFNGGATVNSGLIVSGGLTVNGGSSFNGQAQFRDLMGVSGVLTASGAAVFNQTIAVSGASQFQGAALFDNTLTGLNTASISGLTTLSIVDSLSGSSVVVLRLQHLLQPALSGLTTGVELDFWSVDGVGATRQFGFISCFMNSASPFGTALSFNNYTAGAVQEVMRLRNTQAWFPKDLQVDGKLGLFATSPASKQTVSGAKGSNAALASLIAALVAYGMITDSTTA